MRGPRPPPGRTPHPGRPLPREKSLRDFDYSANPNVDPAVIHSLATCEWITKDYPLCLIEDSGTGKSHLLIGLGMAAAMAG
ncbi:DNA replication protein DnaC [Streptomyces pseudovenezuelae]|uniref:DNA replication protein DnaC n=1 Tax=Streptomyces pseudovenezuelae TaxID=67350 RepID=A0ABT6LXR6_9ACTN|nr:DNA replication protein DnaC [Streptomyces pseudovenezuelae]